MTQVKLYDLENAATAVLKSGRLADMVQLATVVPPLARHRNSRASEVAGLRRLLLPLVRGWDGLTPGEVAKLGRATRDAWCEVVELYEASGGPQATETYVAPIDNRILEAAVDGALWVPSFEGDLASLGDLEDRPELMQALLARIVAGTAAPGQVRPGHNAARESALSVNMLARTAIHRGPATLADERLTRIFLLARIPGHRLGRGRQETLHRTTELLEAVPMLGRDISTFRARRDWFLDMPAVLQRLEAAGPKVYGVVDEPESYWHRVTAGRRKNIPLSLVSERFCSALASVPQTPMLFTELSLDQVQFRRVIELVARTRRSPERGPAL